MRSPIHRATAPYRIIQDDGGMRVRFFCEVSGAAICTICSPPNQSPESAADSAWRAEGRSRFNLCHKCGRWASDVMYNPNTLECVDCSPWEEKPAFCPQCGANVLEDTLFCHQCGARLQYGEEVAHGSD